jgi:amino acid transporter
MQQVTESGLVRGVGRWDLVAIAINGIIGAGIFGLPSKVYALTGAYSLLAFLICALLTGAIVLCFAEVSSRFTETGGPYLFAETAFGSVAGFELGWLVWFSRIVGFATVCNLLVTYLAFLVPPVEHGVLRVFTITSIVVMFTVVNIVGVRASALVTDIFTVSKLIPLVLFILAGLFFINPQNYSVAVKPGYQTFSTAVMLLVFAFSGFEGTTINAGEAREPRRNVPFAILIGTAVVAVVYILIQFVCIGTLPGLAQSERPIADASSRFLGTTGTYIIAIGAIVSMIGNLNGTMLVAPRLHFAMAEQGELPGIIAATHKRFHTPYIAILLTSAVTLVFTLSHSFMSALTVTALVRLIMYFVTALSLLALRRNSHGRSAEFKPAGGVFVAFVSLILCAWLISSSGWREIRDVSAAAILGLLIYFSCRLFNLSRPTVSTA